MKERKGWAGAGPLREFLHLSMKLVQYGISYLPKPVIYFEGQADHKVPVHNQALRQTGSFRALGRIMGHSFLHDGPPCQKLLSTISHAKMEISHPIHLLWK